MRFIGRALFAAVAVVALLLAGCGDGEDRPAGGSASGTGTGSGTGAGSGTGTGSGSGTHAGEEHEDDKPAFDEKDATTNVSVAMADFSFVGIPATVTGPNVLFTATNSGPSEHELHIAKASDEDEALGEIHAIEQGESGKLAVKLEPGSYVALCLVMAGERTHAELGMKTPFTVE